MVRCPDCGADNGEGAVTCNSCGRPIYFGHVVYKETYLGQQRIMYSDNLMLITAAVLALVASASIPIVLLAPENMRLIYATAVAFTLLVIIGLAYGVYRATSMEGPIQVGGQEVPSVEGSCSESTSDLDVEDPGESGSIPKGIRPL